MKKFTKSIIISVMLTTGYPLTACGDQNDPRLDQLFADLQTPLSNTAVKNTESKIWAYWIDFPENKTIDRTMSMAIKLMENGQLHLAENVLSKIIDREPNFAEAWNKRATIRFLIGNHNGSATDIAKVLQLEPRHFGALSGLGMIHLQNGNWQRALDSYTAALAIHPYLKNIEVLIYDLKQKLKGQSL